MFRLTWATNIKLNGVFKTAVDFSNSFVILLIP